MTLTTFPQLSNYKRYCVQLLVPTRYRCGEDLELLFSACHLNTTEWSECRQNNLSLFLHYIMFMVCVDFMQAKHFTDLARHITHMAILTCTFMVHIGTISWCLGQDMCWGFCWINCCQHWGGIMYRCIMVISLFRLNLQFSLFVRELSV